MTDSTSFSEIRVGLGDRSYTITVQPGLLDQVGEYARLMDFHSPAPIVTDETVAGFYGEQVKNSLVRAGYQTALLSFPAGEPSKHLGTVANLYDGMAALKLERKSGVIALGGGVPGDIAGFAAATFLRGVPFIQVPTTLLADVDSSVGGKVGVDHAGGKNLIGAFHQPKAVLIDPNTLQTLDRRQIQAGLAEIIKHGIIGDARLFTTVCDSLERLLAVDLGEYCRIIPWNCQIKANVVEQDERESGLRAILNFGHTYGHAIESLTRYETYLHGEAVALGMLLEAQLGHRLGVTSGSAVEAIRSILRRVNYPMTRPALSADAMLESMFHDKKVEKGTLRLVFPTEIGHAIVRPVEDLEAVRKTWEDYVGF